MRKKIILLVIGCLLVVMSGCSSGKKDNLPTPAPQANSGTTVANPTTTLSQQTTTGQTTENSAPMLQTQTNTSVPGQVPGTGAAGGQSTQPGISIKLGPESGPQISALPGLPGATVNFSYGNNSINVFVSAGDKLLSLENPMQFAVKPDSWRLEFNGPASGSTFYFEFRIDPSAPRTGEVTLSNIRDRDGKVLVAGPINFWITLVE